jgi:hypothetical protein
MGAIMQSALEQMLPLAEWLLLLLATTLTTWAFYKLTTQVGRNVAWLQGPVGSLTVKFGGPAALFLALLWLGNGHIAGETLVQLEGDVTDVNGNPVKDAWIVSTQYAGRTDEHGKFAVKVPRSSNSQYDLVVYGLFDFKFDNGILVSDNSNVRIRDFPDPTSTVLVAKGLTDRDGKPIDRVRVFVDSVARPQGREYHSGDEVKIDIERRTYSVEFKDENDKPVYTEQFHVNPGTRFELPKDIPIERPQP